jgi:tetratricopeptide (TPR) repeat protein
MKLVIPMLFGVVCVLSGCASGPSTAPQRSIDASGARPEAFDLWQGCDMADAEAWRLAAPRDADAALSGAACHAFLVEQGQGDLKTAEAGRRLAQQAVDALPKSAEAHYLLAYLSGLEAQRNPLKALALVPVIEREALAALKLNPALDEAGPARMLGDLYLQAPVFPVSIGDPALAVDYYEQAVELAPDQSENRLGLVDALLTEGRHADACRQLQRFWKGLIPGESPSGPWERGLELQGRMCEVLQEE